MQTYRQTVGQMDRQAYRPTDRQTGRQSYYYHPLQHDL